MASLSSGAGPVRVADAPGVDADAFVQRLRAHDVLLGGSASGGIAMHVNATLLRRSPATLAELFVAAATA